MDVRFCIGQNSGHVPPRLVQTETQKKLARQWLPDISSIAPLMENGLRAPFKKSPEKAPGTGLSRARGRKLALFVFARAYQRRASSPGHAVALLKKALVSRKCWRERRSAPGGNGRSRMSFHLAFIQKGILKLSPRIIRRRGVWRVVGESIVKNRRHSPRFRIREKAGAHRHGIGADECSGRRHPHSQQKKTAWRNVATHREFRVLRGQSRAGSGAETFGFR